MSSPATAAIQEQLVDLLIQRVTLLEGIAGDREKATQQGCDPIQELELCEAKIALAEARIKLLEVAGDS